MPQVVNPDERTQVSNSGILDRAVGTTNAFASAETGGTMHGKYTRAGKWVSQSIETDLEALALAALPPIGEFEPPSTKVQV